MTSLDGKITALDQLTGKQLWTFDTDSPLLSATASQAYAFSVVPGVQGELYTQQRVAGGGGFQVTHQHHTVNLKIQIILLEGSPKYLATADR